jgi:ABC-type transporter MlaC component
MTYQLQILSLSGQWEAMNVPAKGLSFTIKGA